MPAIHQLLAGFREHDAISNEALLLRDIFRSWGCGSDILCEPGSVPPRLRKHVPDVNDCPARCSEDDIALLHLSSGSRVNEIFASLSCRKAILYHNVTPSRYFEVVNPATARVLAWGRDQVASLAGVAELNMADSRFNANELTGLGYRDVHVFPLLLDTRGLSAPPDRGILKEFAGPANVLFGGRCAPNKKIEDCLRAFLYFNAALDGEARFIHVGTYTGTERYHCLLRAMAQDLGIKDVHFAGAVNQSQLNAFYKRASLFLCMSEHEGFCIPVIESMVHEVPVIARAAGAVPETMDGAGILFQGERYDMLGELMARLVRDPALRSAVLAKQRERLESYVQRDAASELKQLLRPLMTSCH